MPTVTMFTEQGLSNSLHNLGPLTTAFSAPESCSSGYNTAVATMARGLPYVLARSNCSDEIDEWFDDCLPSGAKRRSLASEKEYPALTTVAPIYYSPGLECPKSWTTAGVAGKDSDGKLSSSGDVFDVWGSPTTLEPPSNPVINMFIQALDYEETAVMCCPSDYEAIPGGGCYSSLHNSAWTYSELCSAQTFPVGELVSSKGTFTYNDQTYTKMIPVRATETTEVTSYATTEMGPAILDARELVPVVYWPMVTLVHKANDGQNGEEGDSDSEDNEIDDGVADGDNDDENGDEDAAVSVRGSVGLIAGAWSVVAVLGAVVFM